jgi:2-haloacid dehalogenase
LIKTVIFDLDDTLFDFKRSEKVALTKTLVELGIEPREDTIQKYSEINEGQWKRLERGEATREEILLKRYELLFRWLGIDEAPLRAQRSYEKNLSETYFYIDGAEALLEKMKDKYELYIASNGTAKVQAGRIGSSGISKYFKKIFISEELGYNKPSPEFFNECFKIIGNEKRCESIIIGDSLTSDIKGGINAGILTCLYNPKNKEIQGEIKPHYTVSSLDEIPSLLENI